MGSAIIIFVGTRLFLLYVTLSLKFSLRSAGKDIVWKPNKNILESLVQVNVDILLICYGCPYLGEQILLDMTYNTVRGWIEVEVGLESILEDGIVRYCVHW